MRNRPDGVQVEVECATLDEVRAALAAGVPRLLLAHDLDIRIVGYPPYSARGSGDDAVVGVLVFAARDNQLIEAIEASPGYIACSGAEL